jgi:putative membrane protein
MPETPPPQPERDPRVYFAAERTLLAWIRTGLALMGLGFAIARFGLFLRQMQISSPAQSGASAGSAFAGISLMALGVLVNISGALDYTRTIRQLSEGAWIPGKLSKMGIGLAIVLAILGTVMAIRLFVIR